MPLVAEILSLADAQAPGPPRVRPPAPGPLPLTDAVGRYLAEPAKAVVDLPPFRSSAMDGYALRSVDTPGRLPVVFRIAAGAPAAPACPPDRGRRPGRPRARAGRGDGHRHGRSRPRGGRRSHPARVSCRN